MKKGLSIYIGRKEVMWNYLSTFLHIGSGIILFPLILRVLSSETVGMWSIFLSITTIVSLVDFGFTPSFTRNISYIFSGVKSLKKDGISNDEIDEKVDFELLSKTIKSMKWLYLRLGLITLILLTVFGTVYISYILKEKFEGNSQFIIISWILFSLVNAYNIYTLYYDALMIGIGYVKRDKQIIIISQLLYLITTFTAILIGLDLLSMVIGQAIAVFSKRLIAYQYLYGKVLKDRIHEVNTDEYKNIVKVILPNSVKLGISGIGGILITQSSVIFASIYLTLEQVASFGITMQIVTLIGSIGVVYYRTFLPKISNLQVNRNKEGVKKIYIESVLVLALTFIVLGLLVIFIGNDVLFFLKSQTFILGSQMVLVLLIINFLERNHSIAGGFLLSKNEVPFYKASLISGVCTVILMYVFLEFFDLGLWGVILAPGFVQLAYQNWKWPLMVIKDLKPTVS